MYQNNAQNTGFNPRSKGPTEDVKIDWTVQKDSPFYAAPAVVDGVVYAVSASGRIFAIEQQTGVVSWSETINQSDSRYSVANVSSPAVLNGRIYVGSTDNRVYALNSSNGNIEWRVGTGNSIISSPSVDDGIVYIGSTDGKLYALNAQDGSTEWTFELPGEVSATPAVSDSLVFIGADASPYDEDNFFAVNKEDGTANWAFSAEGSITASATVSDEQVYIGDSAGYLYGLDLENGTEQWKFSDTSSGINSTIATDDKYIYTLDDNYVYAVDKTGQKAWDFAIDYSRNSDIAVSKEQVYVGKEEAVIGIDKLDGTSRWRRSTEGSVTGIPAIVGNSLFIGNENDSLFAISEKGQNKTAIAGGSEEKQSSTTRAPNDLDSDSNGSAPLQGQSSITTTQATAGIAVLSVIIGILVKVLDIPLKLHELYCRLRTSDEPSESNQESERKRK